MSCGNYNDMKILIIGGMGIIGGAIAKAAISQGMDVYIVSRRKLTSEWSELGANAIQGDWYNDAFANSVLDSCYDVIIDTLVFSEEQMIRSLNIANNHCKHYFYISTDSVYIHPDYNVKEDISINIDKLKWKYGYNKRKAELYLLNNSSNYSFLWSIIRPTITYGDTRIPVGFASSRNTNTLIERMREGKPILIFDDDQFKHSICHVSILGEAVVGLFNNNNAHKQCYHISDDWHYTYNDIFASIENAIGIKGIYVHANTNLLKKYSKDKYEEMIYDKNPFFTLDNSKIKKVVPDISYHVNLESSIRTTLLHLDKNAVEDDIYNKITDCILLKIAKKNDPEGIIIEYVKGLEYDYIKKLKKFESELTKTNFKIKIKNVLGNIKHCILHLK